jgi:hypothetical protein
MLITGLSLDQFREIVNRISASTYDGNVIVEANAYELSPTRFRARLRCNTGRGAGARTTRSGRHMPIACWHAYRDVLAAVFLDYPNARVQAGNSFSVVYRGAEDFAVKYPGTGRENIGSMMEPVTMPELCECEHEEAYTEIRPDPATVALIRQLNRYTSADCGVRDCDCHLLYAAAESEGTLDAESEGTLDAESGGRTYAGRLDTQPYDSNCGSSQTAPDTDKLLAKISSLIDGDPWTPPAHP